MHSPFSLNRSTILVTGASSGIGRQVCVCAAAMGATVIATGREANRLRETVDLLEGADHRSLTADLTLSDDRARLSHEVGPLNGVIHSAGTTKQVPFKFLSEKHLSYMYGINYDAPMLLTKDLLK